MYEKNDYKLILSEIIEKNRSTRGFQKKMAEACGCHTSFLSQVVNGSVHLSLDHAAALCDFWAFDDDDTDYFMSLTMLARATSDILRKRLHKRISFLRKKKKSVSGRLAKESLNQLSESARVFYYSSWQVLAIHVLCSIDEINSIESISERLSLSRSLVKPIVDKLIKFGFLGSDHGKLYPTNRDLHLSQESPLILHHHVNWRNFAINNMLKSQQDGINYSAAAAISTKDLKRFKEEVLDFIESFKSSVIKSKKEEEVCCLNIDFFPL